MKLVALMAVRNEDWVLGLSLRAVLMWVDEVVIFNHAITDGSADIILEVCRETVKQCGENRVHVCTSGDPTWYEMEHRQRMLTMARADLGATHIAYVDADEVLTGNLLPFIRDRIEDVSPGVMIGLPWLQLRNSITRVHNTGMWGGADMQASVAFQDAPSLHWTSESRGGYDHHHREPMGCNWIPSVICWRDYGLMHLQFLSNRRLFAKQFLYQLTERLRWPGKHHGGAISGIATMVGMYQRTVREHLSAPGQGAVVPDSWWAPYADLMQHLHIDREPWQVAECARLIRENPGIEVGLDNFGLEL